MKVIIINALDKEHLLRCKQSLLATATKEVTLRTIKEKEFREVTINEAIAKNPGEDLFIVGDDITFTPGWQEAIERGKKSGDVIGFSMLYPGTDIVQDYGYDLVDIDGEIILVPNSRGKKKDEMKIKPKVCDSVCGCALFIKKEVLAKIPKFSLEGQNRWGERIFAFQARKEGFRVVVLDHYLFHEGTGTKSNKDKKYSTISYSFEKKGWEHIVKKYVDKKGVKEHFTVELGKELLSTIKNDAKVLLYGAGSVSDAILRKIEKAQRDKIDICTGLLEEDGQEFLGKTVRHYANVDFSKYDAVIITPLDLGDKIFLNIRQKLASHNAIYYVEKKEQAKKIIYEARALKRS